MSKFLPYLAPVTPSRISKQTNPAWRFAAEDGRKIKISRATRRMERLKARTQSTLRKINRLLARQKDRAQNLELRRQVKTLKAAKRTPHIRVRNRDSSRVEIQPGTRQQNRNWTTGAVTGDYTSPGVYVNLGEVKVIKDVTPTLNMDKPRSPVSITSYRVGCLPASLHLVPPEYWYPIYSVAKSKWAALGLQARVPVLSSTDFLDFSAALADKALIKAQAKVYEADLQLNEYIVEWKQVARLLRDPIRTVAKFGTTLERWTRKDAWIYIPHRTYRRFGKGLLVSQAPTGAVLMSMRTRRTVAASTMSQAVVDAAANRWLQYRYGIAPIVKDITKVMALWVDPTAPIGIRAAKARHWNKKIREDFEFTTWMYPWFLRFKCTYQLGDSYSAKQWYDASAPPLSARLNMHPSQWLNVFWNAIPWSFVGDWFINIDEWLTATQDVPWIRLRGNTVTHKAFERLKVTCIRATEVNSNLDATMSSQPIAVRVTEKIRREVDLPRVVSPRMSNAWYSLKNAMTGLALLNPKIKLKR